MAPRPEYVKKITVATVGWNPKACDEVVEGLAVGKKVPIVRVYGTVSTAEAGQSTYGPYIKFKGEFEAVNLGDGKKYRSKSMLLPEMGELAIADTLADAKAESKEATVTFGLDIGVEVNPAKKGGYSFRYCIIPLKIPELKGSRDALSLLGASFGELPLLEGPKSEASKQAKAKKTV